MHIKAIALYIIHYIRDRHQVNSIFGRVAEMADAVVLGITGAATLKHKPRVGSSPTTAILI